MNLARLERRSDVALICAVLANLNRGPDDEPYDLGDFMPGALSEEDQMREFVEAVQRGEKFEDPPEVVASFRRALETNWKGIHHGERPAGAPAEVIRTAGDRPGRGVQ